MSKLTVYLEASDLRGTFIQKHNITIFYPDPELDENIDATLCVSNTKTGNKGIS